MSARHSPVYRKKAASTKSYRKARAEREPEDFTKAIKAADSHEVALKLLAAKQRAMVAARLVTTKKGRPELNASIEAFSQPELATALKVSTPSVEPVQIKDPQLRRIYERAKAREERPPARALAVPDISQLAKFESVQADREPVKTHTHTGPYVHGVAVKMTISAICMRPDLSAKAKSVAVMLALHFPNIKPSKERLKLLTGILSDKTISRALIELRDKNLLSWESGKSHQANEYTCLWLDPVQY